MLHSLPTKYPRSILWATWNNFLLDRFQAYKTNRVIDEIPMRACVCVCVHLRSVMSDSFSTSWTVAHQVPLPMKFSRQEYWNRLPFPSPGDSSWPWDQSHISCLSCFGRQILYHCAPPGKPPISKALLPYRISPETFRSKQGLVSNELKIDSLVGFLKSL